MYLLRSLLSCLNPPVPQTAVSDNVPRQENSQTAPPSSDLESPHYAVAGPGQHSSRLYKSPQSSGEQPPATMPTPPNVQSLPVLVRSPSRLQEIYINSRLTKKEKFLINDESFTQYELNGKDFGPPYRTKITPSDPNQTLEELVVVGVGENRTNTVYRRRNPDSPFYVKKAEREQEDLEKIKKETEILNEIAELIIDNPNMKDHFAVEVLRKITNERPTWITPAIKHKKTFTVADYCKAPQNYPELPIGLANFKVGDLKAAIQWFNKQGYFHNDTHDKNVLYDIDTGKLVLVDFGSATQGVSTDGDPDYDINGFIGWIEEPIAKVCAAALVQQSSSS